MTAASRRRKLEKLKKRKIDGRESKRRSPRDTLFGRDSDGYLPEHGSNSGTEERTDETTGV